MITHLQDTVTLNNGVKMPGFGLGVYKVEDGDTVIHAVSSALKNGYLHIDTATIYDNEKGVGQAVKDSEFLDKKFSLLQKCGMTIKDMKAR